MARLLTFRKDAPYIGLQPPHAFHGQSIEGVVYNILYYIMLPAFHG